MWRPGVRAERRPRRTVSSHVFFEYMPRETSAAIGELFRGFSGYVQADAKSVYDLLFKPAAERPPLDDGSGGDHRLLHAADVD